MAFDRAALELRHPHAQNARLLLSPLGSSAMRWKTFVACLVMLFGPGNLLRADEPAAVKNTQPETVKLLSPEEAARRIKAPEGFRVSLFAGEPDVRQPIGATTDARGRLWVAENNTYAEQPANFDLSQKDRIVILEDADHDGHAERRTVFWDQARKLTSVEVGFGGVWA
ncbi:MAG TPA: hypothetical protein VGJ26_19875, partial [Pirellulales bacterium]